MNKKSAGRTPGKILIIQTAFLGDVILTTPLVSALKESYPASGIDFLTIPKSVDTLINNPKINKVIVFDKRGRDKGLSGLRRISAELREQAYDLCLTPHRSLRSAWLTRQTGADIRIGFDRLAWKNGVLTDVVAYNHKLHEIERNLSLLKPLGLDFSIRRPEIYPDENDHTIVENIFQENHLDPGTRLFALAPGSVWPTKRWPAEYFMEIAENLINDGLRPLLIGGKEDLDICLKIVKKVPRTISLAGKLSLRQSALVLKSCLGLLTNDSAPLHLGLAAAIPVFAIFGATVPEFGFAPYTELDKIIEYKGLKCRPCGIHGQKKCPIKTFDCMLKLNPEQVYQLIDPKSLTN